MVLPLALLTFACRMIILGKVVPLETIKAMVLLGRIFLRASNPGTVLQSIAKLRVVYDASSKTSGPSLNQCLYKGSKFQQLILDLLILTKSYCRCGKGISYDCSTRERL